MTQTHTRESIAKRASRLDRQPLAAAAGSTRVRSQISSYSKTPRSLERIISLQPVLSRSRNTQGSALRPASETIVGHNVFYVRWCRIPGERALSKLNRMARMEWVPKERWSKPVLGGECLLPPARSRLRSTLDGHCGRLLILLSAAAQVPTHDASPDRKSDPETVPTREATRVNGRVPCASRSRQLSCCFPRLDLWPVRLKSDFLAGSTKLRITHTHCAKERMSFSHGCVAACCPQIIPSACPFIDLRR